MEKALGILLARSMPAGNACSLADRHRVRQYVVEFAGHALGPSTSHKPLEADSFYLEHNLEMHERDMHHLAMPQQGVLVQSLQIPTGQKDRIWTCTLKEDRT